MGTLVEIPSLEEFAQVVRDIVREELAQAELRDSLITAKEAAELLGVKPRTVWAWRKEGRFPFVEIAPGQYRFRRSDLKRYVSERTNKEPTAAEYVARRVRKANRRSGEA